MHNMKSNLQLPDYFHSDREYFTLSKDRRIARWFPGEDGPGDRSHEEIYIHKITEELYGLDKAFSILCAYCDFREAYIFSQACTHTLEKFDLMKFAGSNVYFSLIRLAFYKDLERVRPDAMRNFLEDIGLAISERLEEALAYMVSKGTISKESLDPSIRREHDLQNVGRELVFYYFLFEKEFLAEYLEPCRAAYWRDVMERSGRYYKGDFMIEWGAIEYLYGFVFIDMVTGNYEQLEKFLFRFLEMEEQLMRKKRLIVPQTVKEYQRLFYPFLKWYQAKNATDPEERRKLAIEAVAWADKMVCLVLDSSYQHFSPFLARMVSMLIMLEFDLDRDLVEEFLKYLGIFTEIYPPAAAKARELKIPYAGPMLDPGKMDELLRDYEPCPGGIKLKSTNNGKDGII